MKTVGELGLRNFKEKDGQIIESTKNNCPIATSLPMADFLETKPYWVNSKIMPVSGHLVLADILQKVNRYHPDTTRKWGDVVVYRDKMDIHGYLDKKLPNSSYPQLTAEVPISEVAFGRFITKLNVLGDDKYKACVAIKWEPTGCQVAVGLNVQICANFNILGGEFLETSRNLSYEGMLPKIDEAFKKIEEVYGSDLKSIQSMINRPMSEKQIKYAIGDLTYKYHEQQQVINITDIQNLNRQIISQKEKGIYTANVWDFTQRGTEVLRFDNNSGDSILESIKNFNHYLVGENKN